MTELGVPMNVTSWWAATVPAGTPRPIVDQINKWFVDIVGSEDTQKFLSNLGGEPFILTTNQAQALMLQEIDNWREYVRLANITPPG